MTCQSRPQGCARAVPSAKAGKLASTLFQTVALSLLRKASLYEEAEAFQNVELTPVHATLSASWWFGISRLPNARTPLREQRMPPLFSPAALFTIPLHPSLKPCWGKSCCLQFVSSGSISLALLVLPLFL